MVLELVGGHSRTRIWISGIDPTPNGIQHHPFTFVILLQKRSFCSFRACKRIAKVGQFQNNFYDAIIKIRINIGPLRLG